MIMQETLKKIEKDLKTAEEKRIKNLNQLEICLNKITTLAEENFIDWKEKNGIVKFPLEFKEPIKISIDNTDETRHLIIEYLSSKKFTVMFLHIFTEDEYTGGYIGEVLVQDEPKSLLPSIYETKDGKKWITHRKEGISTIILNMSFIPVELRKEYATLSNKDTKIREEITKFEKYIENLKCSMKVEEKYLSKIKERSINDLGMREM